MSNEDKKFTASVVCVVASLVCGGFCILGWLFGKDFTAFTAATVVISCLAVLNWRLP